MAFKQRLNNQRLLSAAPPFGGAAKQTMNTIIKIIATQSMVFLTLMCFGISNAHASEVTGSLSSSNSSPSENGSGSGSSVSGTLSGGSTIAGTVGNGGSTTTTGSSSSGASSNSISGNVGNLSTGQGASQATGPSPTILGTSTVNANTDTGPTAFGSGLTPGADSTQDSTVVIVKDNQMQESSATTGIAPQTAALSLGLGDFMMGNWFWILLLILLILAVGYYGYKRYKTKNIK